MKLLLGQPQFSCSGVLLVRWGSAAYYMRPSLSFSTLEVNLYKDYESSLLQEVDSTAYTPLTALEEVINPRFVAPSLSSTLRGTITGDLTLLLSRVTLAQCTWLEMVESPRDDASCVKNDSLDW